jgi:hypothetical protein
MHRIAQRIEGATEFLRQEPDVFSDVLAERLRHLPRSEERPMGMGRGILLWLLGVPLPIVILLALFWHH